MGYDLFAWMNKTSSTAIEYLPKPSMVGIEDGVAIAWLVCQQFLILCQLLMRESERTHVWSPQRVFLNALYFLDF